jgi:transcriptional regulator with XRE-family HTH domain
MDRTSVFGMNASRAAAVLLEERSDDPDWLDAFTDSLERRRSGRNLERILAAWGLSQSEAGRRFGVSRQAVAKWLTDGIPTGRAQAVADLSAATDLLVRYLKRDRIPAVVRRPISAARNESLLDLWSTNRYRDILTTCRAMFDFAGAQG